EDDKAVAELGEACLRDDLADEALGELVARMRLPGEDELHGPRRMVQDRGQALNIPEEEGGALVAGEAPREPDRENVGIEWFCPTGREDQSVVRGHLPVAQPGP